MLQTRIAEFQKAVRKISTYAIAEEHAWHLGTCYVQRNRLADAAIDNRQPAVRGIPYVNKDDAEKVMLTLLAMRGLDKKKHREAWDQGCLKVLPASLKMQATSNRWQTTATGGEVWNDRTVSIPREEYLLG